MLRTIYLAGKVSGLPPEQVSRKFFEAKEYWLENGCHVINPVEVINDPQADWAYCMRVLIPLICTSHAMYLLHDWQSSRGARIEVLVAEACGIDIILQDRRQKNQVESYINTYAWKNMTGIIYQSPTMVGVPTNHSNTQTKHCICITAAAKYRCTHHNPGHNTCDLDENTTQKSGVPPQLPHTDSDIQPGKKAFEKTWAEYSDSIIKNLPGKKPNASAELPIIERHYATIDELLNPRKSWFENAWEKLCIGLLILVTLPQMLCSMIRNPRKPLRLPFID